MIGSRAFDVVLFDLGGVLVELSRLEKIQAWTDQGLSKAEFWSRWLECSEFIAFQKGTISAHEFSTAMVKTLGLGVSNTEFQEEFAKWPTQLFPGAKDLVERLAKEVRVACFSNINELHWPLICDTWGMRKIFRGAFASHEIGMMKPDTESYKYVVQELECPAERVLFLDDLEGNVEGARKAGLRSFQVKGPIEAEAVLKEQGFLRKS